MGPWQPRRLVPPDERNDAGGSGGSKLDEPDPEVVESARRGDLGAFEQLVRRYQGDVWRLAFHLVHDDGMADDVTQDAFVRAFRFLRRYRAEAKFSTWLFTIARNCAMDELRRATRRRRTRHRAEVEADALAADQSISIEVKEAVAALPLDLREPVVLIDMLGLPYREVARMLSVPEGTVKSRVHRAREVLVERLSPRGQESADEG
jgi:RNA polymerase sigma-70 factor, ECF subfamily